MSDIRSRRQGLVSQITECCLQNHRNIKEVELIAVSKTQDVASILEAFSVGQTVFGENYVQEFKSKKLQILSKKIQWHFIGKIQSNKIKDLVGEVSLIHSVDRLKIAESISRIAEQRGLVQKVLLELNVGLEQTKSGFSPEELKTLFGKIMLLPGIKVEGLMSFPPLVEDTKVQREFFKLTRTTRDSLQDNFNVELPRLSMGTSLDFVSAIAEGSTMVRVGTALFGERFKK